jgi:hypothetical protein
MHEHDVVCDVLTVFFLFFYQTDLPVSFQDRSLLHRCMQRAKMGQARTIRHLFILCLIFALPLLCQRGRR